MTTSAPDVGTTGVEGQDGHRGTSWRDIATQFAWQMAQEGFRRGDLAELRRMNPESIDSPVLMGLLAEKDLLRGPKVEEKWALILHGLALMTPKGGGGDTRTAHDGQMSVGRALYLGGEATREQGFYSETRLKRLLTSRGDMTRTLLARAFRMLAAANVTFSWREMANFIRNDGFDEEAAEECRCRIAREYFQAQYRSQPAATENE